MLCRVQGSSAHKVIAAKQAAGAPAPARVGVREQRKLARKARAAPEDGARAQRNLHALMAKLDLLERVFPGLERSRTWYELEGAVQRVLHHAQYF